VHEALEDSECRVERTAGVPVPAVERRNIWKVLRAQEVEHLELGVHAGLETSVRLEDESLVEDDGRVRLLGRERPDLQRLARERRCGPRGTELDLSLGACCTAFVADEVDELGREVAIAEAFVERPAVDLVDHLVRPPVPGVAHAEDELVRLVRPGLEADLDERDRAQRRAVG
jgi:hypothetical protein